MSADGRAVVKYALMFVGLTLALFLVIIIEAMAILAIWAAWLYGFS